MKRRIDPDETKSIELKKIFSEIDISNVINYLYLRNTTDATNKNLSAVSVQSCNFNQDIRNRPINTFIIISYFIFILLFPSNCFSQSLSQKSYIGFVQHETKGVHRV